jgi:hypothetical protein
MKEWKRTVILALLLLLAIGLIIWLKTTYAHNFVDTLSQ